MKERPILFSASMIRALLAGRKTQTRRAIKPQPDFVMKEPLTSSITSGFAAVRTPDDERLGRLGRVIPCRYGLPGDRLWVRETFTGCGGPALQWPDKPRSITNAKARQSDGSLWSASESEPVHVWYRADVAKPPMAHLRWTPSIHMPRWASRITLELTEVRAERLQEISNPDAIDEGVMTLDDAWIATHFPLYWFDRVNTPPRMKPPIGPTPAERYQALWEDINGAGSWDADPWVWAVSFRCVEA